ncbi:MAG: N-6 DNA methylase, partial [Candidatus Hermodarchaeota archaeon]
MEEDSKIAPINSSHIVQKFGRSCLIYKRIINELNSFWDQVKNESQNKQRYRTWKIKIAQPIYGENEDLENLFLNHTYLLILIFSILKLNISILNTKREINFKILDTILKDFSFDANSNLSFMQWIFSSEQSLNLIFSLLDEELQKFDFSTIKEDIFPEIYEDIVIKSSRHKSGEYYTPGWLVETIIDEVWQWWESSTERRGTIPRILDPSCGSGSFIFHFIKFIRKKVIKVSVSDIVKNIQGFDINPLATYIARVNYLFAITCSFPISSFEFDTLNDFKHVIVCKDALKKYQLDFLLSNQDIKPQKFDILIGNPPWIVMRSIKNKEYQNYLKKESFNFKLISKNQIHLFTQMELASLFFCKTAHLYLKPKGMIANVMPKSVISGTKHHERFRKFSSPKLKLILIYDLQDVKPLFGMPSCVLFAVKGEENQYPTPIKIFKGKISHPHINLDEIKPNITITKENYSPPSIQTEKSWYYTKFQVGVSIFPRSLYFFDIKGKNGESVYVKTTSDIKKLTKPRWNKIFWEGEIEQNFLYVTLLSWEMAPFGYKRLRYVVLPIIED